FSLRPPATPTYTPFPYTTLFRSISHLIDEHVQRGCGLFEATRRAIQQLEGSYSIVVLSESEPDRLVAAKSATPIVLGLEQPAARSEEHTSELQSRVDLVCRLLLE